jgi:hypothetical protein
VNINTVTRVGLANVSQRQALELAATRRHRCSDNLPTACARANIRTDRHHIIDRNVNYTNVCGQVQLLRFIGPWIPEGYVLASTSCSARSMKRSRSAACNYDARRAQPGPAVNGMRSIPRRRAGIPRSSCTRSPPEVIHLSRLSQLPIVG